MKVLVVQSCLTLCDIIDCSQTGSSVHGNLKGRILEWVAVPFSGRSSRPRDWTQISRIVSRFFTIWATREALLSRAGPSETHSSSSLVERCSPSTWHSSVWDAHVHAHTQYGNTHSQSTGHRHTHMGQSCFLAASKNSGILGLKCVLQTGTKVILLGCWCHHISRRKT